MIDVQRLIGEVAAKHDIRLEPNDPAFALVTLNRLVLQEAVAELIENVSSALAQFSESFSKTERRAGAMLAQDLKSAIAEVKEAVRIEPQSKGPQSLATANMLQALKYRWVAPGVVSTVLIFGAGIAFGIVIAGR